MKNLIFLILLFPIILLAKDSSIIIKTLSWTTLTNSRISPEKFFNMDLTNITIKDPNFIEKVQTCILENESQIQYSKIDVRLGIIVNTDTKCDTLCFGDFEKYYYNGKFYKFNEKLFSIIINNIPNSEKRIIDKARSIENSMEKRND